MYRNSMIKGGLYMNIQKELSKGSSSLLVLSVLGTGDMYGYQIIKEIEQRSEFVFSFKEGTLYPILHGFEQEGLVKSYWQDGERGKRRKYYHITDRGLKMLNKSSARIMSCPQVSRSHMILSLNITNPATPNRSIINRMSPKIYLLITRTPNPNCSSATCIYIP